MKILEGNSCCIYDFFDISLLSGKKNMDPQNNSWFLTFVDQFEKTMYTLSQNMISFSAQPSVLLMKQWH